MSKAVFVSQRGFTLVELMVVVAIMGLFSVAAVVYTRNDETTMDSAISIRQAMSEASRLAKTLGPFRADVITATGDTARVQLSVTSDNNRRITLSLDQAEETPVPLADYSFLIKRYWTLPEEIDLVGYSNVAQTDSGGGPNIALAANTSVSILCVPDGKCSAMTLFLKEKGNSEKGKLRIVVMPLSGSTQIFSGW